MKLKGKSKLKKRHVELPSRFRAKDDDEAPVRRLPDWLMTSPEKKKQAAAQARVLSGANRPPEIWFKDGEEKILRIRDDITEVNVPAIWRYQVEVDGKWQSFTAPAEDEVNLFDSELGLRPTLRYVYEVIDVNGYTDRKGKKHRNIARFWLVTDKTHQILQSMRRKRGPLNKFNIEVTRMGERAQTVYQILPDVPSPMTPEMKQQPRLMDEISKYYAPLPESEQRAVVKRAHVRSSDE